jgi:heterotetrameric sarcosine oxidase delta subunit
MLLINCPYCGERDESEFRYGGRRVIYPPLDSSAGIEKWHRAIHLHDNSQEPIREFWYHESACELWIEINRDIDSHETTPVSGVDASIIRSRR